MASVIHLKTEKEALGLLLDVLADRTAVPYEDISVGEWARFKLHIPSPSVRGTINSRDMRTLQSVQSYFTRSISLASLGEYNSRRVSSDLRESVELAFGVHGGSKWFDANIWNAASSVAKHTLGEISPKWRTVIYISLIIVTGGRSFFDSWSKHQLETRNHAAEVAANQSQIDLTNRLLDYILRDNDEDKEITEEIERRMKEDEVGVALSILKDRHRPYRAIVQTTKRYGDIEFNGSKLDMELGGVLLKQASRTPDAIRLDGEYRVLGNDAHESDHFKLTIAPIDGGEEFDAVVSEMIVPEEDRTRMRNAEWGRDTVSLRVQGVEYEGVIQSAEIVRVDE